MTYLDIEKWSRKDHFNFFRQMDYPHFNVCANLDISILFPYLKEAGLPFFSTMIYLAVRAANNIPEFRYRIRKDRVVVHDYVHPSFTVLSKEDAFSFCFTEFKNNAADFMKDVSDKIMDVKGKVSLKDEPNRDDLLYITCLPWISFTSITHPVHLRAEDSIPRISWGKYFEENGKVLLPLSIQANHALMDGVHVGRYFSELQELVNHPETCLG